MLFYLANYENNDYKNDLAFTIGELNNELSRQFNNEGTNFEGSSHYAAFATEALIYVQTFPKGYWRDMQI